MLDKVDIRKWIIAGLLILHIAWIGNHLRWVANDEINPWRMGGYAMYTVPSLGQRILVFDASFPEAPRKVKMHQFERATSVTNYARTCQRACVGLAGLLRRKPGSDRQDSGVRFQRKTVGSHATTRKESNRGDGGGHLAERTYLHLHQQILRQGGDRVRHLAGDLARGRLHHLAMNGTARLSGP